MKEFLPGRARELGEIRTRLDQRRSSSFWVVGLPGVGKTVTVRQAAADFPFVVYHRVPPLSEPQQRGALADCLRHEGAGLATEAPQWEELFEAAAALAPPGSPTVLVVDDAHRWTQARTRSLPALARALHRADQAGETLHAVLVAPEVPARASEDVEAATAVRLAPLTFRGATPLLPGSSPAERLRGWALFGGVPGVLARLDRSVPATTNFRRLVLEPDAPLADWPLQLLERTFQVPARYAAILTSLARGEGDWRAVHDGVPDLSASGQAGPYLKRLEEIGLLEVRRSLDASPRTRNRRYRLTDPFLASWFRWVLPHRHRPDVKDAEHLVARVVRPELSGHSASVLPAAWRDFMSRDALAHVGANAREVGSLWGPGYDIPVAGILVTGTPFYGRTVPAGASGIDTLARLDREIRETRYGFGRERRLRVLFSDGDVSTRLQREAARREDTVVLDLGALAGSSP